MKELIKEDNLVLLGNIVYQMSEVLVNSAVLVSLSGLSYIGYVAYITY